MGVSAQAASSRDGPVPAGVADRLGQLRVCRRLLLRRVRVVWSLGCGSLKSEITRIVASGRREHTFPTPGRSKGGASRLVGRGGGVGEGGGVEVLRSQVGSTRRS